MGTGSESPDNFTRGKKIYRLPLSNISREMQFLREQTLNVAMLAGN